MIVFLKPGHSERKGKEKNTTRTFVHQRFALACCFLGCITFLHCERRDGGSDANRQHENTAASRGTFINWMNMNVLFEAHDEIIEDYNLRSVIAGLNKNM